MHACAFCSRIENINDEICFVCQVLLSSAESYLPLKKHITKKRKFFNSPELKDLCRANKQAWSAWNACGRPLSGQIYLTKKETNQRVKKCVNKLQIREDIQLRDKMFKENDRRRFKCPNIPNVGSKLATDGGQITDPSEILSTFQKYFLSLSSSQIAQDKSQEIITSLLRRLYNQSPSSKMTLTLVKFVWQ